jgi:hypothetical protein
MSGKPGQQVESSMRAVTPAGRRVGRSAAERKRHQRERERQLIYETEDWRLYTDLATLPQKAGCQPAYLGEIVLKELVDNALDAGANVSLDHAGDTWIVTDDGPGIDPADVPCLFSVNRPLVSSKLKRLPLRGMLGNGLRVVVGAVAAADGMLMIETRGRRLTLAVCQQTGLTNVMSDETIAETPGVTVRLSFGPRDPTDYYLATGTIAAAACGEAYHGPSSPWWYGVRDLQRLFARVTLADTAVSALCRDLGLDLDDDRVAATLDRNETETVLARLRAGATPVPPEKLGFIGEEYRPAWPGYARRAGTTLTQADAHIPYIVEAWAVCAQPEKKGQGEIEITTLINRSMTVAEISAASGPGGIILQGCGLRLRVSGPGTGDYQVFLSIIAPCVQLATDGKEPSLVPFSEAIAEVLRKACGAAHRAMLRPSGGQSIRDAARLSMEQAYQKASGNGQYPANARQVMYAARPDILRLSGKDKLDDAYFTQVLLPDFVREKGKETEWDVVFDSRGTFTEPHTGREIPLGTIDVRSYLGDRPPINAAPTVASIENYATVGPEHRYSTVLFIEKEGFAPLLETARIAERYDIAIMSTKGMSTTAARLLLDRLAPRIDKILVMHDFDVSGFSIFGTLGTDGRRYTFVNELPIVDIGLRLDDVAAMDLQSEPVETSGSWSSRSRTLAEHGATREEINFLQTRRVELNAMTAPVFVAFLQRKLAEHGVLKVVPDESVLERHARRVIEQGLAEKVLDEVRTTLREKAASATLPDDLRTQVSAVLVERPELSWDLAVSALIART